jgi:hypothetical protein
MVRERREGTQAIEALRASAQRRSTGSRWRSLEPRTAAYDTQKRAFVALDVVALCLHAVATQHNGRHDHQEPGPIGFNLGLASQRAAERAFLASCCESRRR